MRDSELKQAFEEFLQRRPEEQKTAERETFDRLAGPWAEKLVVYGAGKLGQKIVAGLRTMGAEPLALTDANRILWGTYVAGLQVLPPPEATTRFGSGATFVVAIWSPGEGRRLHDIRVHLGSLGCTSVISFVPLFWKHPDAFLPHYRIDLPHRILLARDQVDSVLNALADQTSKEEFMRQVLWMASSEFGPLEGGIAGPAYFPADLFTLSQNERLADCGAFDGDTVRVFNERTGGTFQKVWAFEPDPMNLGKLEDYARRLHPAAREGLAICPFALSDRRETLKFDALGTVGSGFSATGGLEVECLPLDEVFAGGPGPTLIKMDIEGAEPSALVGASRTIREYKPILAICVYHRQDHLWSIPTYVASLDLGYTLFLRRYGDEFGDVVFYAVPEHRLLA